MKEEVLKKRSYKAIKRKEMMYSGALGAIFALTLIAIGVGVFMLLKDLNGLPLIIAGSFGLILFLMIYKQFKKVQKELNIREKEDPNLKVNKLKNLSIEELQKNSKLYYAIMGVFVGMIIVFIVIEILAYVYLGALNFASLLGGLSFLFFIPIFLKEIKAIKKELKRRNN